MNTNVTVSEVLKARDAARPAYELEHLFGHSILPFSQFMMIPGSVNMY